ncbi:signal peptidase [Caloranaerobacter sp. TR13]|uniref:signal peptidase I n=1 Tax=Caloranaerobacter sp. TR13 TaxID=1302151 RepID=UPI0006D48987|nr:signal peptidase I [Caloranaerobacter sp. TR13]KPU27920.1 signal peptidase [Caloranaerobacter sp. TR13]
MSEEAKKEILEWIKSILFAVVIAIIIKTFIFNTTYVLGYSMYPTLHEGDRLFTNKLIYIMGEPKRGDIVVLKAPDVPDKDYIKRVVAVENDEIKIVDGKVYINGKVLDEYYLKGSLYTHGNIDLKVPKGYVFVLGDNRRLGASKDSRYFGPVPVKLIKGKAVFRYYPFDNRFGSLYK